MLPAENRLRRERDFRSTVRAGVRATSGRITVHLRVDPEADHAPQVGFVVSKRIGNAVHRHRLTRQLRHAARSDLSIIPTGGVLVVRALPGASQRPGVAQDLHVAVGKAVRRVKGRSDHG